MNNTTELNILFVCHGNICRSPMAEFILRRLADAAGLSENIVVVSAATSSEEIGNPVYPLAKRALAIHGIGCRDKVAQRITRKMYDNADYVIVMDRNNIVNLNRQLGLQSDGKVKMLLDFLPQTNSKHGCEIADPWYTRDFETAYNDILSGCQALLQHLSERLCSK